MSIIKIERLSKKYIIGHDKAATGMYKYHSLRDSLAHTARGIAQRIRHPLSLNTETTDIEEFYALKDINLEIEQGDKVGIIGRNGAGKSTLLKILSRITEPTSGKITMNGRVASLLEVGTGFHPELSGRENIFLNGAVLGMSRKEIKKKFEEIVDFAGVEKFLDTPVKRYSSGMYVRLAFAVAAHLDPEILLVDEVLAVGDAEFQKKCLGKMDEVSKQGKTILFISHNMGAIENLCNRGFVLNNGDSVFHGNSKEAVNYYLTGCLASTTSNTFSSGNRTGTGVVKFNSFHIENLNSQKINYAFSGELVVFVFTLDVLSDECLNVDIGFSLHNMKDDTLSVLYNSYQNYMLKTSKKEQMTVRCKVQNLSLNEGEYLIRGRILANGDEADWPKSPLGTLSIKLGDYYKTGKTGFIQATPMVIKGIWECMTP